MRVCFPVTIEKHQVAFKIRPHTLIITMNEHPTSLLPDRAVEVNRRALFRKFHIMHVSDWLTMNGLRNSKFGVQPILEYNGESKEDCNAVSRKIERADSCDRGTQTQAETTVQTILRPTRRT